MLLDSISFFIALYLKIYIHWLHTILLREERLAYLKYVIRFHIMYCMLHILRYAIFILLLVMCHSFFRNEPLFFIKKETFSRTVWTLTVLITSFLKFKFVDLKLRNSLTYKYHSVLIFINQFLTYIFQRFLKADNFEAMKFYF